MLPRWRKPRVATAARAVTATEGTVMVTVDTVTAAVTVMVAKAAVKAAERAAALLLAELALLREVPREYLPAVLAELRAEQARLTSVSRRT